MSKLTTTEVADILEKSASYIDALEAENARLRAQLAERETGEVEQERQKWAALLQNTLGDEIDEQLVEKVATSPSTVRSLIETLTRSKAAQPPPKIGTAMSRPVATPAYAAQGFTSEADRRFVAYFTDQPE